MVINFKFYTNTCLCEIYEVCCFEIANTSIICQSDCQS